MTSRSQHILFLATEYDAPGMRPYARNIINALWQTGDHVLIVTRYGIDNQAFPDIPADCISWINYPTGKLSKAVFRLHPARVLKAINHIIEERGISLVYSLTEELILADHIRALQRHVDVLYTVHDASFHDYKFRSISRWLKDRFLIARPQRLMLERTSHQVTNSREQQDSIMQRYPYHKVHYAPFPSLVNNEIAHGDTTVNEISALVDGYILFFGTIHLYKGVHLLYDAYLEHPDLHSRPLVIAGTRDIYFARRDDETGIVVINRFIEDCELRDLFTRASVIVYPYISATQSGVVSIASYFGKPMVLSDLPFFKQTCEGCEGIEFFTTGDRESLAAAISRALQSTASTRPLYDRQYSSEALSAALNEIISQL